MHRPPDTSLCGRWQHQAQISLSAPGSFRAGLLPRRREPQQPSRQSSKPHNLPRAYRLPAPQAFAQGGPPSTILSPEGFIFPGQNPGCLKGVGILSRNMTIICLFLRAKIFRTKPPGFDPKPFCPENPHWGYAIRSNLSQVGRSPGARGQRNARP